ncbi:hypothetical protein BDZ97DRAFT_1759907 [Flammula alnicola]|nr:hypothetical protein BDZ97DRAFT_1759907 [Flammula alnicola]
MEMIGAFDLVQDTLKDMGWRIAGNRKYAFPFPFTGPGLLSFESILGNGLKLDALLRPENCVESLRGILRWAVLAVGCTSGVELFSGITEEAGVAHNTTRKHVIVIVIEFRIYGQIGRLPLVAAVLLLPTSLMGSFQPLLSGQATSGPDSLAENDYLLCLERLVFETRISRGFERLSAVVNYRRADNYPTNRHIARYTRPLLDPTFDRLLKTLKPRRPESGQKMHASRGHYYSRNRVDAITKSRMHYVDINIPGERQQALRVPRTRDKKKQKWDHERERERKWEEKKRRRSRRQIRRGPDARVLAAHEGVGGVVRHVVVADEVGGDEGKRARDAL